MFRLTLLAPLLLTLAQVNADIRESPFRLHWEDNMLTLSGETLPGKEMKVWYIEAYCRPDSHTTDWVERTVIPHRTELVSEAGDGSALTLRCTLEDGVVVTHEITAVADGVTFAVTAANPTDTPSQAHWAQPCVRVGPFTGTAEEGARSYEYLPKSFVFIDGELATMPTPDWATEARYTPGQVWAGPGVPRGDVNPRPLNPHTPSNGLIGCYSADGKWIFATAWEPYQELFQGVITCLHSDFRIGGLEPGETKKIKGRIYLVPNDMEALLEKYERDFGE